ncbi:hypothetical protein [Siphonobacter sp. BAB-5405]|uniref:hypothetical protein n=1 Tax=Siphonobacter sp. BAB-5405 TaxID=1864825 RepID=UPI0026B6D8B5
MFQLSVLALLAYCLMIFFDSWKQNQSITVASLSVQAVFVQMVGYGLGFLSEGWKYLREPQGTVQTGERVEYPS